MKLKFKLYDDYNRREYYVSESGMLFCLEWSGSFYFCTRSGEPLALCRLEDYILEEK
jgi:hypothetical protein